MGSHRTRLAAIIVVMAALLAVPTSVTAFGEERYGTVTILDRDAGAEVVVDGEARVCDFAFVFDFATDAGLEEEIGWRVRVWAEDPLAGEVVLAGSDGPTDEDGVIRQPRDGWLELPDGRYNVLWDNEEPPDRSAGLRSFTVVCEEDATPTPSPEASVGGETATPEASVGGVVDQPRVTLPPTDAVSGGPAPRPSQAWWLVIAILAGLTGTLLALVPRPSRRR